MDRSFERPNTNFEWIRDLVKAEDQMNETGMVDAGLGMDNDRTLAIETLRYLEQIKTAMVDAANAFNDLKSSPLGRIKIYGIAKTQADFMLFRNGYKMIFSMRQLGIISIRFNFLGPNQYLANNPMIPQSSQTMPNPLSGASATTASGAATQLMEENLLIARKGPFNEIQWTFQEQVINTTAAIKYHLSLFVKESAQ